MEQYFSALEQCSLFAGIEASEISTMLHCLGGKMVELSKGAPVFLEGDPAKAVGVVLSGAIQIVKDDYDGNRSILAMAEPGALFGEAFACAGVSELPVSALALRPSAVLLLDCKRVLTLCPNTCQFHHRLVNNLLQVVAQKNLMLNQKIRIMSQKTTKEKLMVYLLDQAKQRQSREFTIPFNRQALADYLGVERSAMSVEISKLRRAGVLDCKGSWFYLR